MLRSITTIGQSIRLRREIWIDKDGVRDKAGRWTRPSGVGNRSSRLLCWFRFYSIKVLLCEKRLPELLWQSCQDWFLYKLLWFEDEISVNICLSSFWTSYIFYIDYYEALQSVLSFTAASHSYNITGHFSGRGQKLDWFRFILLWLYYVMLVITN